MLSLQYQTYFLFIYSVYETTKWFSWLWLLSNYHFFLPSLQHHRRSSNNIGKQIKLTGQDLQRTAKMHSLNTGNNSVTTIDHFVDTLMSITNDAISKTNLMKKRWEETQTLRADCSKVEPEIISPPQTPFPGAQDGQNLISCRWSLPLPTNPVWWGSMHEISSYCGTRPTNTPTRTHTDRQDPLKYTAPQLAHSVKM